MHPKIEKKTSKKSKRGGPVASEKKESQDRRINLDKKKKPDITGMFEELEKVSKNLNDKVREARSIGFKVELEIDGSDGFDSVLSVEALYAKKYVSQTPDPFIEASERLR